jgi:uncharacterized membrane protein
MVRGTNKRTVRRRKCQLLLGITAVVMVIVVILFIRSMEVINHGRPAREETFFIPGNLITFTNIRMVYTKYFDKDGTFVIQGNSNRHVHPKLRLNIYLSAVIINLHKS